MWRGCDVDEVSRLSRRSLREAGSALRRTLSGGRQVAPTVEHRADRFFADLLNDPGLVIQAWAAGHAITREALSRSVQRLYGASPADIRSELRARAAWRLCIGSTEPLADVALDVGCADQAHMTRSLQRFTGGSPAAWRRADGGPALVASPRFGEPRDDLRQPPAPEPRIAGSGSGS